MQESQFLITQKKPPTKTHQKPSPRTHPLLCLSRLPYPNALPTIKSSSKPNTQQSTYQSPVSLLNKRHLLRRPSDPPQKCPPEIQSKLLTSISTSTFSPNPLTSKIRVASRNPSLPTLPKSRPTGNSILTVPFSSRARAKTCPIFN